MTKSIIAGAVLLVAAAYAVPMLAWSADSDQPQGQSQAAPARPGMPEGGWRHDGWQRGMEGRHGGWMHAMMRRSPQQRCERRIARRAAHVAYVESLLNLTPEQRPLADKLNATLQAAADQQHQVCASLKPPGEQGDVTVLDRLGRQEAALQARLAAVQSAKPALTALYQSLTPEQKAIIDQPFRHRG